MYLPAIKKEIGTKAYCTMKQFSVVKNLTLFCKRGLRKVVLYAMVPQPNGFYFAF
jgi:hypothetical protein